MIQALILGLLLSVPQFQEEVTVHLVTVDVVVTDSSDRQILGLEPEDFIITEDGKPVKINSLEYYSVRHPVREIPGFRSEKLPTRRFVILVQQRLDRTDLQDLRRISRDLHTFMRHLSPRDQVALFRFRSRLDCLSDFTSSYETLQASLESGFYGNRKDAKLPDWLGKTKDPGGQDFMDALQYLSEHLAGIPGRKDMILFSYGFERQVHHSDGGATGDFMPSRQFSELPEILNDANIALHIIDLYRGRNRTMESMLSILSDRTGGYYFSIFSNFLGPLKELEERTNGYYLLTYYSPVKPGNHGYRSISVTVTNPEFKVLAREGYRY